MKIWLALIGLYIFMTSPLYRYYPTVATAFDDVLPMDVQRQASERILQKLQEHPDAWTRVDSILEHSKSQQAKFYALQARHLSRLRPTSRQSCDFSERLLSRSSLYLQPQCIAFMKHAKKAPAIEHTYYYMSRCCFHLSISLAYVISNVQWEDREGSELYAYAARCCLACVISCD